VSQLKELLKIRDYRFLWTAQVASDFGDNLTFLSLMFLVQRLTGSTVALATLMIVVTVPALVFSVVSGVYVDRFDRRKMMILSDFLRAMLVLGFLFVTSADQLPVLYVIAFSQASIATLFNPARSALLPRIVGEEKLLAANSVSQTSRIIFNVLGTTTAGLLAALGDSFAPAFIIDSATFFVSAVLIAQIRTSGKSDAEHQNRAWEDMKSGFRVMIGSRPLRAVLIAAAVAMLGLGATNVLLVPFIVEDLMVSEAYFGLIEFAQVLAMVIAGSVVALMAAKIRPAALVSIGLIGVGLTISAMALPDALWQVLIILFFAGLAVTPTQAGVSTLTQTLIEDSMRGRVGGALNALISAATVASMGLAGVAAAAIGVRNVFLVSGVISGMAGVLAWVMLKGVGAQSTREPAPEAAWESV
jgi:MFS family permease